MSLLAWHSVRQSTYPSIIHTDITQHDGFMSPCNTPLWCRWFNVAPLLNKEQVHHEFSYNVKLLISVYILSFRLSRYINSRVRRTYDFIGKIMVLRICQLFIYSITYIYIYIYYWIYFTFRGAASGVLKSSLISYHSLFWKCCGPVEQFCLCSFV